MIGVIAGKVDKADRTGEDGVHLAHDGLQIEIVLLPCSSHVQVADVHPGQHTCWIDGFGAE